MLSRIALRYEIVFMLLTALFIVTIASSAVSKSLFLSMVSTIIMLALIPFSLIVMIKSRNRQKSGQ